MSNIGKIFNIQPLLRGITYIKRLKLSSKDVYTNDTTIQDVVNELCCGVGKTTYG